MSTLSGARITEMVVNHRAREFGQSKYGLGRVWRVFLDIMTVKMITGFAARPARWFALLGTVPLLLGLLTLIGGQSPEVRQLARGTSTSGTEYWTFPADYPARLRRAQADLIGSLHGP